MRPIIVAEDRYLRDIDCDNDDASRIMLMCCSKAVNRLVRDAQVVCVMWRRKMWPGHYFDRLMPFIGGRVEMCSSIFYGLGEQVPRERWPSLFLRSRWPVLEPAGSDAAPMATGSDAAPTATLATMEAMKSTKVKTPVRIRRISKMNHVQISNAFEEMQQRRDDREAAPARKAAEAAEKAEEAAENKKAEEEYKALCQRNKERKKKKKKAEKAAARVAEAEGKKAEKAAARVAKAEAKKAEKAAARVAKAEAKKARSGMMPPF